LACRRVARGMPHVPRLPWAVYFCLAIMILKATIRRWPELLLCVSVIGLAYLAWQRWL